jgi:hypothetical protein
MRHQLLNRGRQEPSVSMELSWNQSMLLHTEQQLGSSKLHVQKVTTKSCPRTWREKHGAYRVLHDSFHVPQDSHTEEKHGSPSHQIAFLDKLPACVTLNIASTSAAPYPGGKPKGAAAGGQAEQPTWPEPQHQGQLWLKPAAVQASASPAWTS